MSITYTWNTYETYTYEKMEDVDNCICLIPLKNKNDTKNVVSNPQGYDYHVDIVGYQPRTLEETKELCKNYSLSKYNEYKYDQIDGYGINLLGEGHSYIDTNGVEQIEPTDQIAEGWQYRYLKLNRNIFADYDQVCVQVDILYHRALVMFGLCQNSYFSSSTSLTNEYIFYECYNGSSTMKIRCHKDTNTSTYGVHTKAVTLNKTNNPYAMTSYGSTMVGLAKTVNSVTTNFAANTKVENKTYYHTNFPDKFNGWYTFTLIKHSNKHISCYAFPGAQQHVNFESVTNASNAYTIDFSSMNLFLGLKRDIKNVYAENKYCCAFINNFRAFTGTEYIDKLVKQYTETITTPHYDNSYQYNPNSERIVTNDEQQKRKYIRCYEYK